MVRDSLYLKQKPKAVIAGIIVAIMLVFLLPQPLSIKAAINPELPRVYIDTTYPTLSSSRTIWNVNTSCGGISNCTNSLQTAIDNSILGDEIVVQAGMVINGPIVLKNKTVGSGWIVIRTSNLAGISAPGVRVNPSQAGAMPKIESPGSNVNALQTEDKAHNYRIVGIEFRESVPSDDSNVLVQLGTTDSYCATSADLYKVCDPSVLANYAYNLTLDRVYIHGDPRFNVKRGVGLDSKSSAVIDSYISEIHVVGQDAQAIGSINGPGPFKILNNYLEASTENIIFGGDDPRVQDLKAADVEIRGNHLYKPLYWREGDPTYTGKHWAVKNLFEIKNATRVLVDGNIMENNWKDGQPGVAVPINATNQGGRCGWCSPTDITFSNNIIRHTGGGMSFQANDYHYPASTGRTARVKVYNNLWYDLDGTKWGSLVDGSNAADYLFFLPSGSDENGPDDIQLIHNTGIATGTMVSVDHNNGSTFYTKAGFVFTDNIAMHNDYGIFGPGTTGVDTPTINAYFPSAVVNKNVIIGQRSSTDTRDWSGTYSGYPGNFFPKSTTDVGFTNFSGNDYKLAPTLSTGAVNPYRNVGTDGKDIGADITSISLITANVISGNGVTLPSTSDTTPPTVIISSPANSSTVSGTVPITVNVSDNVGVAGVQFKLNGINLGPEDTTAPYSYSWTPTTNGSYVLTAVARDTSNNMTTSPAVTVNVSIAASPAASDIIIYAKDVPSSTIFGSWQKLIDSLAALSNKLFNPDAGAAKISPALAAPINYFEVNFNAQANTPYHIWLRMNASNDSYTNDSLHLQFSDSLNSTNSPDYRIGTSASVPIVLEEGSGAGLAGWGWNDDNYGALGTPVSFAASGTHTLRLQEREDGISVDQIVLSPVTYFSASPGSTKNDNTILTRVTNPIPTNTLPQGNFDSITNGVISGWTFDPDSSSLSNTVQIFINGPVGTGTLVYSGPTDVLRSDVNSVKSITGNHGFNFSIPSVYKDNTAHVVYIYGIDLNDSTKSFLLTGSPKSFTIPVPTPVVGDINNDHIVNSIDYSILNSQWFTTNVQPDLNKDSIVNAIDASLLNANWLKTW